MMVEPVPIVLNFDTHDELIVSYYSSLNQEQIRIKTPSPLSLGDRVELRVRVAALTDPLCLLAQVVKKSETLTSRGRHVCWVAFDDDDAGQRLEEFIMALDPSRTTIAPARQPLKVVVIDDSRTHRERAAGAFKGRGDEVFTANDGLEGLAVCLRVRPDLIVSDVQMPKVDGFQLLRMLKSRALLKQVPVILLTTLSSAEDKRRGYGLGVADYITKPFEIDELLRRSDRVRRSVSGEQGSWAPPSAADSLQGDLQALNLAALLSLLELEQKSGTLYLENSKCAFILSEGRPIRVLEDGRVPRDRQLELVYRLLSSNTGRFEFVAGSVEPTDLVQHPTRMLLLEHARRTDEAARRTERTG